MNGPTCLAYLKQQLVPTLSPRDIVVMDNLASLEVNCVRGANAAVGAEVADLPHYSLELNPSSWCSQNSNAYSTSQH